MIEFVVCLLAFKKKKKFKEFFFPVWFDLLNGPELVRIVVPLPSFRFALRFYRVLFSLFLFDLLGESKNTKAEKRKKSRLKTKPQKMEKKVRTNVTKSEKERRSQARQKKKIKWRASRTLRCEL